MYLTRLLVNILLAASKEAIEVSMEKYTNKSTLDKTNFFHFGFILSTIIVLSFLVFDLNKEDERSFVFVLIFIMWIAYGTGSNKISTFEFHKTTDYTSSGMFAGICLSWWVAYTDYFLVIQQPSRFTGLFLAFALLFTLGLIADFMHYFSDKAGKSIAPWYVVRPGQILLLVTLGAMLYFFVFGSWTFHIGSPFEFLSRVMRGY
jgi:hypothetical protein